MLARTIQLSIWECPWKTAVDETASESAKSLWVSMLLDSAHPTWYSFCPYSESLFVFHSYSVFTIEPEQSNQCLYTAVCVHGHSYSNMCIKSIIIYNSSKVSGMGSIILSYKGGDWITHRTDIIVKRVLRTCWPTCRASSWVRFPSYLFNEDFRGRGVSVKEHFYVFNHWVSTCTWGLRVKDISCRRTYPTCACAKWVNEGLHVNESLGRYSRKVGSVASSASFSMTSASFTARGLQQHHSLCTGYEFYQYYSGSSIPRFTMQRLMTAALLWLMLLRVSCVLHCTYAI